VDRDLPLHVAQGLALVRPVVRDQIVGRFLQGQRPDRRFGQNARVLRPESLAEQLLGVVPVVAVRGFSFRNISTISAAVICASMNR
jgi:hypothetical protein